LARDAFKQLVNLNHLVQMRIRPQVVLVPLYFAGICAELA
jgi:hypothetical protein